MSSPRVARNFSLDDKTAATGTRQTAAMTDATALTDRLTELIKTYDVPGATVGVLHDGEVIEAAAGVINLNTGVETTTDTVFQVGSQGKTWTAVAVMRLVDEGKLDLDEPIRTYLPGFKVADPEVSAKVTLRHLLTHTSGIDGDHFEDFGRGDDCLERYVESCAKLQQVHPFGATMSYCNTGYSIAGRIIEVITGKVWDQAMRELVYTPLGLTHTSTLPEEAILHRVSAGHMSPAPGQPLEVAPVWLLPRITGPAGLINSTVRDVLTFARVFIDDGRGPEGKQFLSPDAVKTMLEPHIEIPDPFILGTHWGVGMIVFEWDGKRLYGHDGDVLGQHSMLRILPDDGVVVTLLTNATGGHQLYRVLFSEILSELAGVKVPPLPEPPAEPPDLDLADYAGSYERLNIRYDLAVGDGELTGTATIGGPLAAMVPDPVQKVRMVPVDKTTFLVYGEGDDPPITAVFYEFEGNVPQYFHSGARANRRTKE